MKKKIKSTKKHTTFAFNSLLCLTVFKPFPPENSAHTLLLPPNSRTIKDQIFKLQGRNLLHRFQINHENVPNNNGLLFLRPTIFIMQRHWQPSQTSAFWITSHPCLTFISSKPILFCFLVVWKCSSIKIQGLSRPWKRTLKIQGFQDVFKPCEKFAKKSSLKLVEPYLVTIWTKMLKLYI